ncbi:MAG: gliding motility-associated C-terminal domain-containing protein [Bacteroidota bacterium]
MHRILLLLIVSCFSAITAWSQCDPDQTAPVFDDPPTEQEVTVCLADVDFPVLLMATDICDGPLNASPIDDTTSVNGICNGGTIVRSWTAVDAASNETTVTKIFNVLPDDENPSSLYQVEDRIELCENADYQGWARQESFNILGSAFDDCGVAGVSYSPEELDTCNQVMVSFILEDYCGNTTVFTAQYTLADNDPPVFDNFPEDIELGCSQSVPDLPDLTATDECSGVREVTFLSQDQVEVNDGDNCDNFQIIRKWRAVDNCGNMVIDSQIIQLIDTLAPTFSLPFDVALECDEDINDLDVTGDIRALSDDCDVMPTVSRRDTIVEVDGRNETHRIWTAVDACGNTNSQIQRIIIRDTIPPSFVVPADIMVDCGEINDLGVTGEPTMIMDNCDDDPEVTREDIFTTGSCESGGAVERVWRVTDKAGNVNEQIQRISIEDDSAPEFTMPAEDITIDCTDAASADSEFQAWIAAMGNAVASDNCTNPENLIWMAFNSGTTDPATLSNVGCTDPERNIDRQQAVDFVVQDECGNVNTTTATFTITDNFAPVFAFCPPDTTVLANDGSCTSNFQLIPPIVTETCGTTAGSYQFTITENIQSDLPNDRTVPVNTVRLDFPVNPSSNFANDSVALRIVLRNVDAEESSDTEFFNILTEDGAVLATKLQVPTQCGTSETVIDGITAEQINQWAGSNSQVTFFLEPNLEVEGGLTVNDICGSSEVQATLFFETLSPTDLTYEYQINGGVRQTFSPEIPVLQELSGVNTITYYATDCSGNTGSCSYEVNVLDTEPPSIVCPNDTTLTFGGDACTATYQLPAPSFTEDNCNTGSTTTITMPMDTQSALVTFNFDPDLNDYLANDKDFVFSGLTANVANEVTLTIAFRGDVDSGNAFFNIIGDDDLPITTTALGQSNVTAGDCNNFSITTITLSAATYNAWAADGTITITANSNGAIPIPPGGPGDGVNPCAPDAINANGEPDGVSAMFASLTFDNTQYEYFATGATNIAPTTVEGDDTLPEVEFEVGETEVFYVVEDASNNSDTCSFIITVVDEEAPIARCTGTTISINPSGIEADTLQAIDLDFGSTDNCGIDTMFLSPNVFDCSFADRDTVNVTLTVVDRSGNASTCEAPVRIIAEAPEPSYFIPPCGGDSLFLFANPPLSESNNAYTYAWSGPDGFVSNLQNPIITNIDQENAGSYQVTITGITACTATGIAEVAINDIPIAPDILAPDEICSSEELILMTSIAPEGVDVIYRWYGGMAPNDSLIGTTTSPSLSLGEPENIGMLNFYVQVEVDGCQSSPSVTKVIKVIEQPEAIVIDPNPDPICEDESIDVLGTFVTGNDIMYEWRGPNGYFSNAQIPPVITDASVNDDGIYTLIIKREVCVSEPANVVVTVRPKPNSPNLSVTGGRCEGDDLTLRMNVSNATVYRWIEPGGNIRTSATNELVIPDAGIELSGPWTGFVTQGGCDSDISTPLQVNINPTPNLAVSANPNPICTGDDLQLNASPNLNGAIYEWSGPSNYLAVGQSPLVTNFREDQAGTYTCKITTDMGCVNTKDIEVNGQTGVRITGISNSATTECLASPTDIRLVVTVFPPDDGTYTYKWTGPRYSSTESVAVIPNATEDNSGNYSVIVSNPASCSSEERTTTVSLKDAPSTPITPLFSELTRPPFCEGEELILATNAYSGTTVQYKWSTPLGEKITTVPTLSVGELSINDAGEYAVVVNIDGCDSRPSGTIPVTVNIAPEIMASSNSPVCEGAQLELESDLIENATYEWEGPTGLEFSGASPVFTAADPTIHSGTFRVRAIVDGCPSPEVAIDVEVTELPEVPMAVNNGPICIGEEGAELRLAVPQITSTSGATYTWFDESSTMVGENIPNLVHTITNFEDYQEGSQEFRVIAKIKECPSEPSAPTMVIFNEIPANVAYAGEDVTLCEAEPIDLDATAPSIGSGMWEQIAGETEGVIITNPDDPNTTILGLEGSGTFIFDWKLSNGACKDYSTDQLTILVNPDAVANAGFDVDTCQVTSILLNADAPLVGQGRWTQPEAQEALGVRIDNIFDANSKVEGLQAGNQYFFTWEILDGLCGETADEVTVIVSNGFAYAGEDFNDCGDGCVNLNAAEPTSGVGMWTSTNQEISFNNPADAMTLICGLEVGVNELIWTADNGACGTMSSDTVIVNYQPLALAQDDTVAVAFAGIVEINAVANDNLVASNFSIDVMDEPSNGTLEDFGDGTFEYQANPNFKGTDGFSYELCTAGCECSIAIVTINVGGETACKIPSIITPNQDGVNDQFIIPCLVDSTQFPDNKLTIFNQWGDEVFHSTAYQNDWEGTYNSEDLPDGTYYYVLNFGDGSAPASGYVIISR